MVKPSRSLRQVPRPPRGSSSMLRQLFLPAALAFVCCVSTTTSASSSSSSVSLSSVSSPSSTPAPALHIHRRRECLLESLWEFSFTTFTSVDALFDGNGSSLWTRGGPEDPQHDHESAVTVANGKLVLTSSDTDEGAGTGTGTAASRVSVHKPQLAPWAATPTKLRVHVQFPDHADATVAVFLHPQEVTSSLTLRTTKTSSPAGSQQIEIFFSSASSSATNSSNSTNNSSYTVTLVPPCALSSTRIHVVELEWTPSSPSSPHWLRWYIDGHFLYETTTTSSSSSSAPASLEVDLSLSSSSSSSTSSSGDSFQIKQLQLHRVFHDSTNTSESDPQSSPSSACWPRVVAHDANCRRHHTRFYPRLGDDHQGYLSLDQIYKFIHNVPSRFPSPAFSKISEIGVSTQNRSLLALCIGACGSSSGSQPQVLFTGMHHSREPISMMNLIYTIDLLILDFQNGDLEMISLLFSRQLWFILVVNPDGYARNEKLAIWDQKQAGQRKNARYEDPKCALNPQENGGVDLNRNYDICFKMDNIGSSTDPCGEDFRGPEPFSEPETRAIKEFVESPSSHISVSLNYHSFGRYFNIPFACKTMDTPKGFNLTIYEKWAKEMTFYNKFTYGQPWKEDNLYSVNGETSDWLWAKHGIFAMSPEVGPSFDTPTSKGFWPAKEEVPLLALELHYSNLVAARLAGPQYEVVVDKVTRQQAAEAAATGEGAIAALWEVEMTVQNNGLRTAGDVEIVMTSSLEETEESETFTTVVTVKEETIGTVRDYTVGEEGDDKQASAVRVVLAIPEQSSGGGHQVLHVLVRDALSCQYIRVSVATSADSEAGEEEEEASFTQWQSVALPPCGICKSLGRSTSELWKLKTPVLPCDAVDDLVQPHNLVVKAKTKQPKTMTTTTTKAPLSFAPVVTKTRMPSTTETTLEPKPTATATIVPLSPSPTPSHATTSPPTPPVSSEPKKTTTTTTTPSPLPVATNDDELNDKSLDKTAAAGGTGAKAQASSSSSSSTSPSFVSVPIVATVCFVVLVLVIVVLRRQRRNKNKNKNKNFKKTKKATGGHNTSGTNKTKKKQYTKVVNDDHDDHDGDDDDDHDEERAWSPRGGSRGDRSKITRDDENEQEQEEEEDAEYGRRRSPKIQVRRGGGGDQDGDGYDDDVDVLV